MGSISGQNTVPTNRPDGSINQHATVNTITSHSPDARFSEAGLARTVHTLGEKDTADSDTLFGALAASTEDQPVVATLGVQRVSLLATIAAQRVIDLTGDSAGSRQVADLVAEYAWSD